MQYDYSSLSQKVTKQDVTNYINSKKSEGKYIGRVTLIQKLIIVSVVAFATISIIAYSASPGESIGDNLSNAALPISALILLVIILFVLYQQFSYIFFKKIVALHNFAIKNNFIFTPNVGDPEYPGMIFSIGDSRMTYEQIKGTIDKVPFELSNYKYTIGDDEHKQTKRKGYIAIDLERKLPHMVLDAKKNNTNILGLSISNLSRSFNKDQVLSLEGDFNNYFTFYAPEEYKTDALYIFTPDLMALFIDESDNFDAEVIDNKLFIYSSKQFDLMSQAVLSRLFQIIEKVGGKALTRGDNYRDENIGNKAIDQIAPQGARLKSKAPFVITIALVFVIIQFIKSLLEYLSR